MALFIRPNNAQEGALIINLEQVAAFTSWPNGSTIDFKLSTGESASWFYKNRDHRDADFQKLLDTIKI